MHKNNPYSEKKPDFARLASRYPSFAPFVTVSDAGIPCIDFKDPRALKELTHCLLKEDWTLDVQVRDDRICPPVLLTHRRLDYIYHLLDIEPSLPSSSSKSLRVLDIGTGATAIYPILLHRIRPLSHITATELDNTSYQHALQTLETNKIPASSITVVKAPSPNPILFPLLKAKDEEAWDFTMCNPPFFESAEEMQKGIDLKEEGAHAAPTAADNELITRGGEVAFISSMIRESTIIDKRCQWFTSLVGKYSSLEPLIALFKELKIDNYFVKISQQAKTARWIIGWSHTTTRLPDSITRPSEVIPNTSFTQILPPSNMYMLHAQPGISIDALRTTLLETLASIELEPVQSEPSTATGSQSDGDDVIVLAPKANTWSRAARREAARIAASGEKPAVPSESSQSVFRTKIRLVKGSDEGSQLEIDWTDGEGKDRETWESFCKFLLSKMGLTRKKIAGEEQREQGSGRQEEKWGQKGSTRGRGSASRGRGHARNGNESAPRGSHKRKTFQASHQERDSGYAQRRRVE
ncbi:hypothetical protein I350_00633 [Cryptococcus amylolentus CBS 6273]|uniref:U6 small nuclear RNA (adenine-(43)-N(6))-methyltransferase n=1 Tax=Cryptococcus amylolentus CBS 6273 TaxID=1296118 RepID=A0A1E3KFI7_9TREE|nr:hypothetical protein I350_00633 [Cryptococcus amylolentus CBS 6273]